jgi:VanZ family protein
MCGRNTVQIGLAAAFCLLIAASIPYLVRIDIHPARKVIFLLILIAGFYLSWQQKIFAERIHAIEYGLLGWFVVRDLSKDSFRVRKTVCAVLIVGMFGLADEFLQLLLPYRVWDLRDIGFNFLGGIWGISLFLIKGSRQELA